MRDNKEEKLAKQWIVQYLPELCMNGEFVIVDELNDENNKAPDLQNEIDNIGIEVTIAEPQAELEIKNIAFKKRKDEEFLKLKSKDAWSIPIITEGGYRILMGGMNTPEAYYKVQINPLKEALNKKL